MGVAANDRGELVSASGWSPASPERSHVSVRRRRQLLSRCAPTSIQAADDRFAHLGDLRLRILNESRERLPAPLGCPGCARDSTLKMPGMLVSHVSLAMLPFEVSRPDQRQIARKSHGGDDVICSRIHLIGRLPMRRSPNLACVALMLSTPKRCSVILPSATNFRYARAPFMYTFHAGMSALLRDASVTCAAL